jgi:hypothetical protein
MRRGEKRVMVHSADGHRTRKGGNSGAPPDLYTTALASHSTPQGRRAAATALGMLASSPTTPRPSREAHPGERHPQAETFEQPVAVDGIAGDLHRALDVQPNVPHGHRGAGEHDRTGSAASRSRALARPSRSPRPRSRQEAWLGDGLTLGAAPSSLGDAGLAGLERELRLEWLSSVVHGSRRPTPAHGCRETRRGSRKIQGRVLDVKNRELLESRLRLAPSYWWRSAPGALRPGAAARLEGGVA